MLLVHDIREIDTFVFAEGAREERKAAELRAVQRIFGLLPERRAACPALWSYLERRLADARDQGLFGAG